MEDRYQLIADAHEKAMNFFKTSKKRSVSYPVDPKFNRKIKTPYIKKISAWEEFSDGIEYEVEKKAMTKMEDAQEFLNFFTELEENPRCIEEQEELTREIEDMIYVKPDDIDLHKPFTIIS
ncbi:MAG: hypothetical protein PHU12_01365 [Candidatus Aenigmarchaeota archaeon]|nr:hypothetical protein [Candidatus Aenigmarchaeota archaeon]